MAAVTPSSLADRLILAVTVVVLAALLTTVELLHPSLHLGDGISLTSSQPAPASSASATTAKVSSSSHQPSSGPASTATIPTSSTSLASKTAITTSLVHLRSGESVNSSIIAEINGGTTVQLGSDADADWQQVSYQGKTGFIYRAYLQY